MKVSIIVPVYNVSRYLRRCLDSIGRQTFRDFEVIAVDDGSTDDSGRQLDEYEASFPLRRIHQANQGLSGARNSAMAVAQGEYLLMVDSDDCIHPRLLELAVRAADAAQLDFVVFDYRRVPEAKTEEVLAEWAGDRAEAEPCELSSPPFDWFVDERRWPCAWQFLYRRDSLAGRSFLPGILYEDIPFVMSYLAGDLKGAYLKKELYCYTIATGSITGRKDYQGRMAGYAAGLRFLRERLDATRYRKFVRRDFAVWLRSLWRDVHALPETESRRTQLVALADVLRKMLDGDLVRWGDFNLCWMLRFARTCYWEGRK